MELSLGETSPYTLPNLNEIIKINKRPFILYKGKPCGRYALGLWKVCYGQYIGGEFVTVCEATNYKNSI